jgi:hypothetical protein
MILDIENAVRACSIFFIKSAASFLQLRGACPKERKGPTLQGSSFLRLFPLFGIFRRASRSTNKIRNTKAFNFFKLLMVIYTAIEINRKFGDELERFK